MLWVVIKLLDRKLQEIQVKNTDTKIRDTKYYTAETERHSAPRAAGTLTG